ncbi:MAG: hypothetical protein HY855_10045 [Burkholderiales bacterium]|nr:hypothetical protein [Burkholderiales bacterium]
MNRITLSTARQQIASLGLAAVMTLSVLSALGQLAVGYQQDAAYAAAEPVTVQQVVIVGQRAPRS